MLMCANYKMPLCVDYSKIDIEAHLSLDRRDIIYFADLDTLWPYDLRDLVNVQARIGLSASSFGCMLGTTRGLTYGQGDRKVRALVTLRRWNQSNTFAATPFALTRHQCDLAAALASKLRALLWTDHAADSFKKRNAFMHLLEDAFLRGGLRWAI